MEIPSPIKDNAPEVISQEVASREKAEQAKKRTTGNKVFDLLVYPTIAFGAVFIASIATLHMTKYGNGPMRKKYEGWVTGLAKKFESSSFFKGKSTQELKKAADNYISVGVSFATGTVLIAPIKIFEDYRGKISRKIDQMLGTLPDDPEHYAKEPKQNWLSVLGGRAITFATILTLATVAGKPINSATRKVSEMVAEHWKKRYPGLKPKTIENIKTWSWVTAFEGFYTALCASLLYVISRGLARNINKSELPDTDPSALPTAPAAPASTPPVTEIPAASRNYTDYIEERKSGKAQEAPVPGI